MVEKTYVQVLLTRLRRQAQDVLIPVLLLIAAGQVSGVDWLTVGGVLLGGLAVTAITWVAGATPTTWWERLAVTIAGAFVAVVGTDAAGWLTVEWWPGAVCAIAASAVLSLLRTWTADADA